MANIPEGVFAIHKPPGITSAQVIRDAQSHFTPSSLFAPWLQRESDIKTAESNNQRNKRRSWKSKQPLQVKIGHGGTLDPLATGVLILGVGSGTKALPQFLTCTKSYDTVVLFGAATDTYDSEGKVVARKPYSHITKESVEQALAKFRGEFMQRPPIFSAIRVQGKHLYEYAREGKEVPVEIQERKMNVETMEMVEWLEGGSHGFDWPQQEAEGAVRNMAEKVLHLKDETEVKGEAFKDVVGEAGESVKRKREADEDEAGVADTLPESSPKRIKSSPAPENDATAIKAELAESSPKRIKSPPAPESDATAINTDSNPSSPTTHPCPAPAARIRMTVSSGFYVRSLAHDLGAAVGSLGLMASLVRTRQGEFELGKNVLEYADLAEGEKVWGPKVKEMLQRWQGEHDQGEMGRERDRGRHERSAAKPAARAAVRRNSSSDEG
ncbi:pseudouridine synthase pus4 [Elasticomyces elasticus]|nr:pseudouridine synthase pus4 [Elasticomyces elasticus]